MKRILLAAGIVLLPALLSSADKLNLRPGLWEVTTRSVMTGAPSLPPAALEKLTPEQRMRLTAVLAARADGVPRVRTSKRCITKEKIDDAFLSEHESCRTTRLRITSTTEDATLVCGGEHQGTGRFHFEAPNPQAFTGKTEITRGEGEHPMNIKIDVTGKWLGADCGGGKP